MRKLARQMYGGIKRYLPTPLRREIEDYARYRRQARKQNLPQPELQTPQHPYWERREVPVIHKPRIRIGIIGAGNYAQFHLRALATFENVELTAILSTGAPRLHETATTFGIPKISTNLDAFLEIGVDAYVIVASAEHLRSLALRCLETKRPILVEKPAGANAADTCELIQQAEKFRTFGMVCMNRRFYSVIEHGLAVLAGWGPIRAVMLEMPMKITQERKSKRLSSWDYDHFLFRNSIHGIDLIRYILGEPSNVYSLARASTETQNAGASFASILQYDRNIIATITDAWDTNCTQRIKIVAEKGWLEYEPFEVGWLCTGTKQKQPIRQDDIDKEFRPGVYAQDLHFVQALRKGLKPALPASLLPDAYKTMRLIEQIEASTVEKVPRIEPAISILEQ